MLLSSNDGVVVDLFFLPLRASKTSIRPFISLLDSLSDSINCSNDERSFVKAGGGVSVTTVAGEEEGCCRCCSLLCFVLVGGIADVSITEE